MAYGVGLPPITAPPEAPVFLADGHSVDEDSIYAVVESTTGHSRTRRRYTVTDRVVTVKWLLEPEQLTAVDAWYEDTLLAGTREFAARVRNQGAGPALLWWRARWIDFSTEMMHLGRGMVSGRLLLTGEGQVDGPETGSLAMEVSVALLDIRSSVGIQANLAMEVLVALLQPTELAMEIEVALLSSYFVTGGRITEDDVQRWTEDGDPRVIEDGTAPPAPPPPPTDPYFASVALLVHMDGTNGSTTIVDSSSNARTPTANGNAQLDTSIAKFGSASCKLDGSGDYVADPQYSGYNFGTGDFTAEFWVRFASLASQSVPLDLRNGASASGALGIDSGGAPYYYAASGLRISGSALSTGVWYHVALARASGNTKLFVDGTQVGSTYTGDTTNLDGIVRPTIGADYTGGQSVNGYIDEVRITKGVARYTASFTPPTAAFPEA